MNQFFGWLLYFIAVAGVIAAGWSEPLRNRFLTPQPLNTPVPQAAAQVTPLWKPMGTSLDRGAYETKGGVTFSKSPDPRAMGSYGDPSQVPTQLPVTPPVR